MSKDTLPAQSTTLEALLRGEGLDKRNNSKNDEESLLEIQVRVWNTHCMRLRVALVKSVSQTFKM